MTLKSASASSLKAAAPNKNVLEKLGMTAEEMEEDEVRAKPPAQQSESSNNKKRGEKRKKDKKSSAADRREELLKQLKAVENAIAKKRTKLGDN